MEAESVVLGELFRSLNCSGIRYVVLRNSETLPYSLGGSDLDLLVSRDQFDIVCDMVMHIVRRNGGRCISVLTDFGMTVVNYRFCGRA